MYFSFSAAVRLITRHFRNQMRQKSRYTKIPEDRQIQNTETVKRKLFNTVSRQLYER